MQHKYNDAYHAARKSSRGILKHSEIVLPDSAGVGCLHIGLDSRNASKGFPLRWVCRFRDDICKKVAETTNSDAFKPCSIHVSDRYPDTPRQQYCSRNAADGGGTACTKEKRVAIAACSLKKKLIKCGGTFSIVGKSRPMNTLHSLWSHLSRKATILISNLTRLASKGPFQIRGIEAEISLTSATHERSPRQ